MAKSQVPKPGKALAPGEYAPYEWDGREAIGARGRRPAPRGEYTFEVRALPVGADASDPDAWLTEHTGTFVFADGPGGERGGPPEGRGGPPDGRGGGPGSPRP